MLTNLMRKLSLLFVAAAWLQAADGPTALGALTGDDIFSRLIEHNRQAELNLRQIRLNELLSVVQLYKALGGGWQ